jgi:hypothetical protein
VLANPLLCVVCSGGGVSGGELNERSPGEINSSASLMASCELNLIMCITLEFFGFRGGNDIADLWNRKNASATSVAGDAKVNVS